jgi:hypothetical protein
MDSRESSLQELLQFARPIDDLAGSLSAYGFDCPEPLVTLSSTHISSVLKRYLAGELSTAQIEQWANAIECRSDVHYLPSSSAGLALHELANPLLTRPLTRQSAATLVAALS